MTATTRSVDVDGVARLMAQSTAFATNPAPGQVAVLTHAKVRQL
jgi:hypothetical protein